MRVDQLLHQLGHFESRKKAQVAIQKNLVQLRRGGRLIAIKKSSEDFSAEPGDEWLIASDPEFQYVSRAGVKLAGALDFFNKSVSGLTCLDMGLSTGGFTDCLLQRGASLVVGVDVGQGQLHPRLQMEPRLKSFDKINGREPLPLEVSKHAPSGFDFMVVDVSFISLLKVLAPQRPLLKPGAEVLALVKPQFEVGPALLSKKGVVARDEGLLVLQKTVKNVEVLGFQLLGTHESTLAGEDGNQEFFIYCRN